MKFLLSGFLMMFALASAHAALAADTSSGSQTEDWGQLRRDVNESARRPGANGDLAARRQAIRDRARTKYREVDSDGNGSLSRSELGALRPRLAEHFDFIDSNRDGSVTESEIAEARRKLVQQRRQQSGTKRDDAGVKPN